MKVAVICCTPYHIFNAVNMKLSTYQQDQVDLYICDHFQNSYNLYQKIQNMKLFSKVFYVTDSHTKYKPLFAKLLRIFRYVKYLAPQYNKEYDVLHTSTNNLFTIIFYEYLINKNPRLQVYWVEDGVAAYVNPINTQKFGKFDKLMMFFGQKSFYGKVIERLYLYEPQLYTLNEVHSIVGIPKLTGEHKNIVLAHMNFILDFDLEKNKGYEHALFIYFDQPLLPNTVEINEVEALERLCQTIHYNDIVVKLHPRSQKQKYSSFMVQELGDSTTPWELVIGNIQFTNKVFITFNSTAVFNSKIIYDEEYDIILLYKWMKAEPHYREAFEKYILKAEKLYQNKKVYIPNTQEELEQIIRNLTSNVRENNG